MIRHSSLIMGLAIHPHVPLLVTGSSDNRLIVWDYNTENPLYIAEEEPSADDSQAYIYSICWDHTGEFFSYVTPTNTVKTCRVTARGIDVVGHDEEVDASEVCLGNAHPLIAVGDYENTVAVSSPREAKTARFQLDAYPIAMAFSQSDRYLAVATAEYSVFVIDWLTGRIAKPIERHTSMPRDMCFVDRDRVLLIGCWDQILRYDRRSGDVVEAKRFASASLYSMSVIPASNSVVAGCMDGQIRLCNYPDFELLDTAEAVDVREPPIAFVYCLSHSTGREVLTSGGDWGDVRFWSVADARLRRVAHNTEPNL